VSASSALYEGVVHHRRRAPTRNAFSYRVFLPYLDLDELPTLFEGRWLWGYEQRRLATFRRRDHWGPPEKPLAETVRSLVGDQLGRRPRGPIRLLTHLRYLGYCFNPVSFYYCFDERGREVEAIVAEVSNTPWGEMHPYVLDAKGADRRGAFWRFALAKNFHVSPFMPMDIDYDWRFTAPAERLVVHMKNLSEGEPVFDATMALARRPVTGANLAKVLARHPFMTGKVITAIHWQAFKLWWKRTPFHPHPKAVGPEGRG
jgi:hypothetical protein